MTGVLRRVLSILLLVVVSSLVTLIFLEVGIRLFNPQTHFTVAVNTWDSEMGIKQIVGARGCLIRPEFAVEVAINSKGLRDREYPYAKPGGTRRILCLGDSFTFGYGVDADEAFPKVLERFLNEGAGDETAWEVINAGVCATGTAHQLAYYNTEGCQYEPDLVVLCFCGANDFVNSTTSKLYRIQGGELVKRNSSLSRPTRLRCLAQRIPGYSTLFGKSHLVTFLKYRIARYVYQRRPEEERDPAREAAYSRRAQTLTQRLLVELRDCCAHRNSTLIVMVVSQADSGQPPERVTELIEYIKAERIPFVDLATPFDEQVRRGIENFYPLDGHWNRMGHELVARLLYEFLLTHPESREPVTAPHDARAPS